MISFKDLMVGDWMQHANGNYFRITRIDMWGDGSVHFACGHPHLYTMLNDDFNECYTRIHYWWSKLQEQRKKHSSNWVYAFAQPYRDPLNPHRPIPQWQKDMANWVNKKAHYVAHSFQDFEPRKAFRCIEYFK